ncbi:glutaredoxin family protein [Brucella tritici]|uniref:Glutaredoxin family protein n=1 Tax=Brucella tritici TaxID=94626 RepID=A0A7V8B0Y2_9HYPH|nr:glutaredoxin family protein [Brucella tritici]KAB2655160.1 glutaredoxin family protein [Brucella tritici]
MLTVYTKKVCPSCTQLKHYLDREGIDYETIDLEDDATAFDHVMSLGHRAAPVIELGHSSAGFYLGDPKFREIIAKAKALPHVAGLPKP